MTIFQAFQGKFGKIFLCCLRAILVVALALGFSDATIHRSVFTWYESTRVPRKFRLNSIDITVGLHTIKLGCFGF